MATYHNENRIGFNYEVNTEELRSQRRVELEQARMRSVEDDYNEDWDHITAYLDSREDKIDLKSSRRSNRSPSTIKSSSQQTPSESDSADEEGDKKVDKNDRFAIMDSINYAKRVSYDSSWLSTSVFSLQLASNAKVIKKTENTVALNHYHGTHVKMKFLLSKTVADGEATSLYLAKSPEEAQSMAASGGEHTHFGYLDLKFNDQQIVLPDDFPIKEFSFEEPDRMSPTFIIINRHNNFKCNKNHLRQALTTECSLVSIQLHVASKHDPTAFVPQFPVLVVHLTGTYHSSEPREVVKAPQSKQAPKPPKPPKTDGKTTKYLESLKEMVNWLKANPQIDHDTSEQFTQLFAEGFLQFNNQPLLPAPTYYSSSQGNDVYTKAAQMDLDQGDFSFNIAEF